MNFIEELRWRGMLQDMTPGIEEIINSQKIVGYIGFDPTAPSLTIGNFVQIQLLKLFQRHGHTPIVLLGGATGRIGDPSGKDKERDLKTEDELDRNLNFQLQQFKLFLDFEGDNAATIVNNHDFYKNMGILEFLRKVGKTLTVNYMTSKDSVKNRLETGLSFTEFSYQLLQAYDYQCLYDQQNCILQMGGSDQWGNITSGTEFIRRNCEGKAYAITTPLLTKSDGKKFGKSEQGNVWLDAELTSPYKFYQFWLNIDDADLVKFQRYFSLKPIADIESLEVEYAENPRGLKRILSEELTERVHGAAALKSVVLVTELLFGKGGSPEELADLTQNDFKIIAEEVPTYTINKAVLELPLLDILVEETRLFTSKSDARRALQNNALSINKKKLTDLDIPLKTYNWLAGSYLLFENGKKNKYLLSKEN